MEFVIQYASLTIEHIKITLEEFVLNTYCPLGNFICVSSYMLGSAFLWVFLFWCYTAFHTQKYISICMPWFLGRCDWFQVTYICVKCSFNLVKETLLNMTTLLVVSMQNELGCIIIWSLLVFLWEMFWKLYLVVEAVGSLLIGLCRGWKPR